MVWFAIRPYLLCGFVSCYDMRSGVSILLYTYFDYFIPDSILIYTITTTQHNTSIQTIQQHTKCPPNPKPLIAITPVCKMITAQTTGFGILLNNIVYRATAGRGLFAGLQDVKHYNVESGWAKRKSETAQPGILGSLWSRLTGL
ncbi:hypothetical protein ACN38_g1359 [Penicillium nordicum]|uniref:Uncharacterized protein n=1 Tax=Penicillium nordicum TaxID=229535 RepID=A0A0M8P8X5_9EURO|nr:hypothetical protein ACN38_g1359 [Penicillium nordicum]